VLVNILVAVATVYAFAMLESPPAESRRLSHGFLSANSAFTILTDDDGAANETILTKDDGVANDGISGFMNVTGPPRLSVDVAMPYIKPTLVQILLSLIQVALLMFASQGPWIVRVVNCIIGNLQTKMNNKINDDIKSVVDEARQTSSSQR